jgi:DNA-directed RNA polymerase specialized sigma24 family protein
VTTAPSLREYAAAAERTSGVPRIQVLEALRSLAQHLEDLELLDELDRTSARRVARDLGVSRQAIQQRARVARRRSGGGS